LHIRVYTLQKGSISHNAWNPLGPISFNEMSSSFKLTASFNDEAININPSSPIMFPLMLRHSSVLFDERPFEIHLAPYIINSLKSKYNFLIFFEDFNSFARGFPTSLFMKFLAKLNCSRLVALLMIGIAPSDLRSFSPTLRTFSVSF
jgi:hypothetical protein